MEHRLPSCGSSFLAGVQSLSLAILLASLTSQGPGAFVVLVHLMFPCEAGHASPEAFLDPARHGEAVCDRSLQERQ